MDPLLASLDERKQFLEHTAQEYAREVQIKVRALLGSLDRFEEGCKLLFRDALAGKALDVQAVRERFLGAFARCLILMNKAHGIALHADKMAGRDLPEADQLAAESIEVMSEKVQAIREKHGFPQAWYDRDSEPF